MTETKIEQVWGELDGEGRHYTILLNLTIKELFGSGPMPEDRALTRVELTPMSGMAVENGRYTLNYTFNGKEEKLAVRAVDGTLLSADPSESALEKENVNRRGEHLRDIEGRVVELAQKHALPVPKEERPQGKEQWDAFICHASEDKEGFVRPLAELLSQKGLEVWYDDFTLTVGDSLRRSIDRGLGWSRFGIVVLSSAFFEKEWPQRELDGLVAREVEGRKVILPVWHEVGFEEVKRYSPTLADRVAAKSSEGLEGVVCKLIAAMLAADQLESPVAGRALHREDTPSPFEEMEKGAESEELSVSISQGVPENLVIIVKNESDSEVTIKKIVLTSKGIRLTDPAVPPSDKAWKIPAHGRLQIQWKATPDPTAKLRSIYDRWAWNPPEHLVPEAEIHFAFYCDVQGKPLKQSYKMLVYVDCNRRIVEL
jgi:hypothetical protein